MELSNLAKQYLADYLDNAEYIIRDGHVYVIDPIGDVETLNIEAIMWAEEPYFFSEEEGKFRSSPARKPRGT